MKKFLLFSTIAILAAAVAMAVVPVNPSKKMQTKQFAITNFDELKVYSLYTVEYEQTNTNQWSVEVTAPDNVMPYVEVSRRGDCLALSLSKKFSSLKNFELKAKIKAPVLNEVSLAGASTFKTKNITLAGRKLELNATGASDYDIKNVTASKIEIDLNGASSATISKVAAQSVDVELKGASDAKIGNIATSAIEAEINGASTLTMSGTTDNFEISASGSSTAKCESLKARVGKLTANGASTIHASVSNILLQRSSGASTITNKK